MPVGQVTDKNTNAKTDSQFRCITSLPFLGYGLNSTRTRPNLEEFVLIDSDRVHDNFPLWITCVN